MATTKFSSRTPWAEKMNRPADVRIVETPEKWQAQYGRGKMLIATPRLVEKLVMQVKKGHVTTIRAIREHLAREYKVGATCPLTTGIFLRIIAENAEELRAAGQVRVAPYWRVVRDDGSFNEKFPGGIAAQASRLKEEGIAVRVARGKPRIESLEDYLVTEFR